MSIYLIDIRDNAKLPANSKQCKLFILNWLDLENDGNGAGVGRLTVLDRVHEALAELRGIDGQIQLGNAAIADETSTI